MTRVKVCSAALLAPAIICFFSADASAGPSCIQPPYSVPGLTGAPVWLPPTPGSTAWRAQLNDPRWAGGPMTFFPSLAGGSLSDQFDAQYRVVALGSQIYVSIQVFSVAPSASDHVYFGITGGTGPGAYLFEIAPDTTDPPVTDPTNTVQHDAAFPIPMTLPSQYVNYYSSPNVTIAAPVWSGPSAAPAWIKNVATWTNSPGVNWAITFQIDTTTVTAGAPQMFFGALLSPGTGTVFLSTSPGYSSGSTGAQLQGTPLGVLVSTGSTNTSWLSFSPLGTACPTGISISPMSIGVRDPTTHLLTNAVATTCATPGCTAVPNDFEVQIQGVPTSNSQNYAVRTRIRVADWGSTIADPNAPWEDFGIPANIFSQPSSYFTTTPGWAWAQATSTTPATSDFTCTPSGHLYCPWLPNANGQQHQCILAEIGLAPGISGAGWNIQQAAAYRNMEFGPLSNLVVPATITLKGLQKVTGVPADRDVYLLVQTQNMPPHGRTAMELSQRDLSAARQFATHPPSLPRPVQESGKQQAAAAPPALLDLPLLTGDQALTQVYPTYRVLTYYDSGKTIAIKGHLEKVLVPMAPFGFYLNHQGPFFGFNHSLEFLGAVAKEIAPNFYVVHVGNEGEFHVRTNISAEEQPLGGGPPPPPPVPPRRGGCSCDMIASTGWSPLGVGLAGLGAAVLWARVSRRRRARPPSRRA